MKKRATPKSQSSADGQAFRLSRIYAEGWNAGKKLSVIENDERGTISESLNPYPLEPQRSRWAQGFAASTGSPKKYPRQRG